MFGEGPCRNAERSDTGASAAEPARREVKFGRQVKPRGEDKPCASMARANSGTDRLTLAAKPVFTAEMRYFEAAEEG